MNICHLITRMILGGAQENTLLTLEYLKKTTPWNIHLAYGPEFDEGNLAIEAEKLGVQLHPLKYLRRNLHPIDDVRSYFELTQYFSSHSFDLVHTHSSKAGIIGRIAARNAGVTKIVHTIHGLAFDEYQSSLRNFIYRSTEQIASRHCDAIISVCETMKQIALKEGLGEQTPIRTIYSAFHLEPFLKVQPRSPDGRLVLGMIARMFPLKGHEDLMLLAHRIFSQWADVDLYLVGEGPLNAKWQRWIKSHPQWENRIVFAGRVAPEKIPEHLSRMDALIHLSWREGLPRTVAQGLAAGRPACVYNIGGVSEIITDNETGFLITPGDLDGMTRAIHEIRNDRKTALKMGENGRKKVTSLFSFEKMGQEIVQLYQEL
jgi:glycosyltransferase involved in cell wall biosynthesis